MVCNMKIKHENKTKYENMITSWTTALNLRHLLPLKVLIICMLISLIVLNFNLPPALRFYC